MYSCTYRRCVRYYPSVYSSTVPTLSASTGQMFTSRMGKFCGDTPTIFQFHNLVVEICDNQLRRDCARRGDARCDREGRAGVWNYPRDRGMDASILLLVRIVSCGNFIPAICIHTRSPRRPQMKSLRAPGGVAAGLAGLAADYQ